MFWMQAHDAQDHWRRSSIIFKKLEVGIIGCLDLTKELQTPLSRTSISGLWRVFACTLITCTVSTFGNDATDLLRGLYILREISIKNQFVD